MKFEKLDYSSSLANGTSLQGYVRVPYSRILEVFGAPSDSGDGYKVQVEWIVRFEDDLVATIYDWKEDVKPEKVTDWHIGGFDKEVVQRMRELL